VGGAVLGVLVTLVSPRQYASTARLQIARETAQVVSLGAVQRDVSIGDQEFYQTQYGLMRAQDLAERVARDLGVVDDAAFFKAFAKGDEFAGNPGAAGRAKRNEIAGHILLDHVEIAPIHGSSLVDIQARSPAPALSQRIAQTWSQDFIASNLQRRLAPSNYARQFLEARLEQLRGRLEASERRAAEYAATHGIIDLPTTGNSPKSSIIDSTQARSLVADDLVAFNAAREAAAADRVRANSALAAFGNKPDASEEALKNRAIAALRGDRAKAAAEYARLAAQSKPDDPSVMAVRAQVDTLDAAIRNEENRIRDSLQQTYLAATTRQQALTQQVNGLKSALAELRQRSIQYNIYQRDADTNRELYNALLQRYKEVGVAGAAESNNVAVIDTARLPDQPSSPRLSVNLLLFTLAGALVGAIVAFGLDLFDDKSAERRDRALSPGAFTEP
ncbi:MAG: GumC family protein, partial [Phenylobacterium sp.]